MHESLTIEQAAVLLEQGQVVVIPTETVYGLGACINNEAAIQMIYRLKGRPSYNPLIVHIAGASAIQSVARDIPDEAYRLAEAFWPGPLTLVLPKQAWVSPLITAGGSTVAVRVPDHPVTLQLLQRLSFGIAAPSANPSNYISPTSSDDVRRMLPVLADNILEGGRCAKGIESTVVGFENGQVVVYRHGALSAEQIEAALQTTVRDAAEPESAKPSPGMMGRHYSPRTKLIMSRNIQKDVLTYPDSRLGILSLTNEYHADNIVRNVRLSPSGNLEEAAHHLFAAMHLLDSLQLDMILAEWMPGEGLGVAINDRLQRAAAL